MGSRNLFNKLSVSLDYTCHSDNVYTTKNAKHTTRTEGRGRQLEGMGGPIEVSSMEGEFVHASHDHTKR